jgi:hypothetical protein
MLCILNKELTSFGTDDNMAHAILSSVAYPGLLEFSTLSHKWCNFRKTVTDYKMCVMSFPTYFV